MRVTSLSIFVTNIAFRFLMKNEIFHFQLGVLITVFSLRNRTSVLVTVFQDSSNCLSEIPLLYLQPVISFFLLLAFYIFWISVILCLASAG